MSLKIGVTERGDPSIDMSWVSKMDKVDAAIIITTNLSDAVIDAAMPFFDKLKFHVTCTGYGGTVVERNTPQPVKQLQQALKLVNRGFPKNRIVIRVDPIIPTEAGIERAKGVITMFAGMGFESFRVSIIDMYPHVRDRFREKKLPLPYGENFAPSKAQVAAVDEMLGATKTLFPNIVIESCAETLANADAVGCVSAKDADAFGITLGNSSGGYQRKGCLCCSAKTELLSSKQQCPYGCLYCYWR